MMHGMAARGLWRWALPVGLLVLSLVPIAVQAGELKDEYSIKAAFVYKFSRYIQWPDHAFAGDDDTLRVTVFADPELAEEFRKLEGTKVGNHIVRIKITDDPVEAQDSHVVFLGHSQREIWPRVQAALLDEPVLLVGEMNGFLESGGIINLRLEHQKIKFQVNLEEARERGLTIGSRILKLASSVIMPKEER